MTETSMTGLQTSTMNFSDCVVRGYHRGYRAVFGFLPGSKSGTTAWYCGPTRIPPPPARTHTHTHTHSSTQSQYSGVHTVHRSNGDRGYPPCSSSLLEPELPSSQQLVPLPDKLFPPGFAAPGPLLPPPAGALPLRFPGASGFLSSIAGMTRTKQLGLAANSG